MARLNAVRSFAGSRGAGRTLLCNSTWLGADHLSDLSILVIGALRGFLRRTHQKCLLSLEVDDF